MQTREDRWINKVLGGNRYVISEKLGEGGMGSVYLAEDRKLGNFVVVKTPHPTMLHDREFASRFQLEIQSLVSLTHAHIVRVLDVGQHGEFPFVVLQFLSGGSLESRLYPGGQLPPQPQSLRQVGLWLSEISSALDFIHGKGFVHRDIKPANILFDEDQHAYLTDFGIAKVLACEENNQAKKLTATGMILGTAEYMAPELLHGKPIDHRVDQYALAVMVFEALSGTRPYEESNPVSLAFAQTQKPIPQIHTRIAGLSEEVSQVLSRAMSLSPDDRYSSCAEFTTALRSVNPNLVSQTIRGRTGASAAPSRRKQSESTTVVSATSSTSPLPGKSRGTQVLSAATKTSRTETNGNQSQLAESQNTNAVELSQQFKQVASSITGLLASASQFILALAKDKFLPYWKTATLRTRAFIGGGLLLVCLILLGFFRPTIINLPSKMEVEFTPEAWKQAGQKTASSQSQRGNSPYTFGQLGSKVPTASEGGQKRKITTPLAESIDTPRVTDVQRQGNTWRFSLDGLEPGSTIVFDASIGGRGVAVEYVVVPQDRNELTATINFPAGRSGERTVEVGVADPATRNLRYTLNWVTQSEIQPPKRMPWTPQEGVDQGQGFSLNYQEPRLIGNNMLPTAESPVRVQMQFSMAGKAGMRVVTRTTEVTKGGPQDEYERGRGIAFAVDYNGASIYLYDPAGSRYVVKHFSFPNLQTGVFYDLIVEDSGTMVRLILSRAGTVIADMQGAVTEQPGANQVVVLNPEKDRERRVTVKSLTVTTASLKPQTANDRVLIGELQAGNPIGLSRAKPYYFGEQVTLGTGESVEIAEQFTPLQGTLGKRLVFARSTAVDGRNQFVDAMLVEVEAQGSLQVFHMKDRTTAWSQKFRHDPLRIGRLVDLALRFDGTNMRVVLSQEDKVLIEQAVVLPTPYTSFRVGAANIMWDSGNVTDRLERLKAEKIKSAIGE